MWFYKYKELIKNLVISDLKVKYSGSILGIGWSFLNPLMFVAVLYFVFNNFFGTNTDNYLLFLLVGIINWRFFANGTNNAMNSIVGKPTLITKVYFPRQILVFSSVLSSLISFIIELSLLIPFILIGGIKINPSIFFIFIPFFLFFLLVLGFGFLLSSLFVYYRDVNQIWEVLLTMGFFLTPISYQVSIIPKDMRQIYLMNPVTSIIETFRQIILSGQLPDLSLLSVTALMIFFILIGSYILFKRLSYRFAEEV